MNRKTEKTEQPMDTSSSSSREEKLRLLKERLLMEAEREKHSFPLSCGQRALWLASRQGASGNAYKITSTQYLSDDINIPSLRKAFQLLINRHPVLRTRYLVQEGELMQEVQGYREFDFTEVICSGEKELEEKIREITEGPMDPEKDNVFSVHLLQHAPDRVLVCAIHHIACDGWSFHVLMNELHNLYEKEQGKRIDPLPPLQVTYKDFVCWQQEMLAGEEGETMRRYWMEKLSGELPVLDLPVRRSAVRKGFDSGPESVIFTIDPSLYAQLRDMTRREKVTLYVLLLSVFQVLLYRYSGQQDIITGSSFSGRKREEFHGVLGYFLNQVALRGNLSGNPSFKDFLRQIQSTVSEAIKYQDYPFSLLADALTHEGDHKRSPVFQAFFNILNSGGHRGGDSLFEVDPLELVGAHGAKFDLELHVHQTPEQLSFKFVYPSERMERTLMERMASHFKNLLASIATGPDKTLNELEILDEKERASWVALREHQKQGLPDHPCLHGLVEQQALQHPAAVAIIAGDHSLTYGELNQRANRLARYLLKQGAGPGRVVGVCLERSPEMIIALLAILKTGSAYVALDPSYPPKRLAFVAMDASIHILLLQQKFDTLFPEIDCSRVYTDTEQDKISREEGIAFPSAGDPSALAYIAYTSGSTGEPKGVKCHHRGVSNYLHYLQTTYRLGVKDTVLQLASMSFDASVRDIFGTLTSGACLVMVKDPRDTAALQTAIEKNKVTAILSIVPGMLSELLAAYDAQAGNTSSLRLILTSGEALAKGVCDKARYLFGEKTMLVNQYGPTECTMTSTYYVVTGMEEAGESLPVGKPIPNGFVCLLRDGKPVPPGAAGEICIGGAGVTYGYHRREELTREKFIEYRSDEDITVKLYRTGDLGRFRVDGNLEFLGRMDKQVKIRGFRVEPQEVEAVLSRHEAVSQCAVVARGDDSEKWLEAYLVFRPGTTCSPAEIKRFAATMLPDYMVPAFFIELGQLPLMPNGKVDFRALQNTVSGTPSQGALAAPSTAQEELLAGLWKELLNKEAVGVDQNFFELGGTSLKAIRLVAAIHKAFHVLVSIDEIFAHPTIRELGKRIAGGAKDAYEDIPVTEIQPYYELSHAQKRLWVVNQMQADQVAYNIPGCFRFRGELHREAFEQAVYTIIERHESLRTVFVLVDGEPRQQVLSAPPDNFRVEYADLTGKNDKQADIERLTLQAATGVFDLSKGPLLRVKLVRTGAAEHLVLFTIHHIIADAWSMHVFLEEFMALYASFREGKAPAMEPLRIQYRDFVAWQKKQLEGERGRKDREFWKSYLAGNWPVLDLPVDFPRPEKPSFKGDMITLTIGREITAGIRNVCQENDITLFMALVAYTKLLLYRYTGQEDLVVGSPVGGRPHKDLENQIGFYISTVILRSRFNPAVSFKDFLFSLRENIIKIYEHGLYPLDKVVEELDLKPGPGRFNLFDVMIQIQDTARRKNLPGELLPENIKPEMLRTNYRASKFDLTFNFIELEQELFLSIEYNSGLFRESSVKKMGEDLMHLMETLNSNLHLTVSSGQLLTGAEEEDFDSFTRPLSNI